MFVAFLYTSHGEQGEETDGTWIKSGLKLVLNALVFGRNTFLTQYIKRLLSVPLSQ